MNGNFRTPFSDLSINYPFDFTLEDRPLVILGDSELPLVDKFRDRKVIGWLGGEPRVVMPHAYEFAEANIDKFDIIFTFDKDLLSKNPKFKFCPFGTSTFSDYNDRIIHPKTKQVSIIGNVRYCKHPGHFLRKEIIENYFHLFDSVKHGWPFEDKRKYINAFRYSVVIENCKQDYYFSEKLIDALLVGTIPIYWGCDSILDFGFNPDGIIQFSNAKEIPEILSSISDTTYKLSLKAVEENHRVAHKYLQCMQAQWLWDNGIKDLV